MRVKSICLLALTFVLLTACGGNPPTVATATQPLIAPSGPTEISAELATAAVPEPTVTTGPTLPAPTAELITPEANTQLGPNDFPPNVNPLTGLTVADPTV